MSRWGELIPHREDDEACLCGCQDVDAAELDASLESYEEARDEARLAEAEHKERIVAHAHDIADQLTEALPADLRAAGMRFEWGETG